MRLLIVGDMHGQTTPMRSVFAYACRVEADQIIQVGDFGYGWERKQYKGGNGLIECAFVRQVEKMVEETGIPLYWLDGNHENFDMLGYVHEGEETMNVVKSTPQPDGTHELRPGVFYIPRGTMLERGEKKILVCGGAASVDKARRSPYISWWPQETIKDEDVAKCLAAGKADILLTHDLPLEVTVIDRHLEPGWGEEAVHSTYFNRVKVSEILKNSGATLMLHGHLHHSYTEEVSMAHGRVKVIGLDRDGTPSYDQCHLLNV
ncbi:MAG: metallophosphoesterase [Thaumarchaeota archaeon]|nr:metallophosphoesterase [Nitrososphaerota archaeon]